MLYEMDKEGNYKNDWGLDYNIESLVMYLKCSDSMYYMVTIYKYKLLGYLSCLYCHLMLSEKKYNNIRKVLENIKV